MFTNMNNCVATVDKNQAYNIFITLKSFLMLLCSQFSSLTLVPCNHLILFLPPFVSSFFHLAQCFWDSSMLSQVSVVHFLLCLSIIPLYDYIHTCIHYCKIVSRSFCLLTNRWTFELFLLLGLAWRKLLWTFTYVFVCWQMFSFALY